MGSLDIESPANDTGESVFHLEGYRQNVNPAGNIDFMHFVFDTPNPEFSHLATTSVRLYNTYVYSLSFCIPRNLALFFPKNEALVQNIYGCLVSIVPWQSRRVSDKNKQS